MHTAREVGACCTLQPCLQGFGLRIQVWNLSGDDGGVPKGGATGLEMTCFPRDCPTDALTVPVILESRGLNWEPQCFRH